MPIILSVHTDIVRTMAAMTDINLVVCGSGSNDGYATVWKTTDLHDIITTSLILVTINISFVVDFTHVCMINIIFADIV